jgi:hypothetical protein
MPSFRHTVIFLVAYALMTTFAFCNDSHESDSQVWKVGQNRWTVQEEYNYGKWIETNVAEDFFIDHDIRVDCADVPYALRWIYSRIHHLPAAATTSGNRLIGHWSKDWARIPTNAAWDKDRRFRAALMAMLASTSTKTLPFDTYPIRITADSVTGGTVFLAIGDHSGVVSHIVMDGSTAHPVQTLEAGSPAKVQKLHRRNLILPNPHGDNISGLLKFKWPVKTGDGWRYLPVKEHPFYSGEQYSSDFTRGYGDYLEAIAMRIDPKVYDPNEKAEKVIHTITKRLNERIPIVLTGYKKCHETQCPEESRLWEIYSTPDRDEFIGVMVDHLERIIKANHLDRDAIIDKMAKIELEISPGQSITLQYAFENFQWLSSDPEDSIEARWAVNKCGMIANRLKSARESISFIQKKYSNTDPLFAEREIQMQQEIVDKMTREGQKSNCATGPR